MNISRTFALALVGAMTMTGCISIDGTRARLNSKDAAEVKKGEDTIYQIATAGRDSTGFINFTTKEQVEYIKLTSNKELLFKIIDDSNNGDVIEAAIERIDFTESGVAKEFVLNHFGKISCIHGHDGSEDVSGEVQARLKAKIISNLTQDELLNLIEDKAASNGRSEDGIRGGRRMLKQGLSSCGRDRDMLIAYLIRTTDSPDILLRMLDENNGANRIRVNIPEHLPMVKDRLLALLDKVSDQVVAEKLLTDYDFVKEPDKKLLLLKKLPESRMVGLALDGIKEEVSKYNVGDWEYRNWDFETATKVAASVKDSKSRVRLVATVLSKLHDIKRISIETPMVSWTKREEEKMARLRKQLPQLSDSETGDALCLVEECWPLLVDSVSPSVGRQILVSGKVKHEEFEAALSEKISPENIDMALYLAVKSDKAKKILAAKMPENVKKDMEVATANAFAVLMEKAKEAAKTTFELDGFYLGMTMDDAKAVFLHHFPDGEVKASTDGYALYVSGQRDPLCRIYTDTKVVYQFNFGKAIMKKWYKYDAATAAVWARTYAKNHGIKMELEFLDRDGEVYVPNGMLEMTPYSVSLHQETYHSKNAVKNYRLTYFGERKIHAFSGGPVARALAEDKYSAISADEGTLRATIEND